MKGYHKNIEAATKHNKNFRQVEYTGAYLQLVLMTLQPGESIGMEVHGNDQFFRIDAGKGKAVVDGNEYDLVDGSGVIVPAGAKHNITNTSTKDLLQLYTIYAAPHHKNGVVFATKAAAEKSKEVFDGIRSE